MTSAVVLTTDSNLDSTWDYTKLDTKSAAFNTVILNIVNTILSGGTIPYNRKMIKIITVDTLGSKSFRIIFEMNRTTTTSCTVKYTVTSPNKVDVIASNQDYTTYDDVKTDIDYCLTQIQALAPATT